MIPLQFALRHRMMMVSSNAPLVFEYTGNYTDNRDANGVGTVEFTSSGTLTVLSGKATVFAYILGAGGGGAQITNTSHSRYSASGGGGGYQTVEIDLAPGTYEIVIGTGGHGYYSPYSGRDVTGDGGNTTAFGVTSTGGIGGEVATPSGSAASQPGVGGSPNGGSGNSSVAPGGYPNGGASNGQSAAANAGGNGLVRLTFS